MLSPSSQMSGICWATRSGFINVLVSVATLSLAAPSEAGGGRGGRSMPADAELCTVDIPGRSARVLVADREKNAPALRLGVTSSSLMFVSPDASVSRSSSLHVSLYWNLPTNYHWFIMQHLLQDNFSNEHT